MNAPHSHAGSPRRSQFSPQPAPRTEATLKVAAQATLLLGGRPLHPPAEAGQERPAGCREGGSVSDQHRSRIPALSLTSHGDEGLRAPGCPAVLAGHVHIRPCMQGEPKPHMRAQGGTLCMHELCAG